MREELTLIIGARARRGPRASRLPLGKLTVFLTASLGCTPAEPKNRQMERIALKVFFITRLVLDNALERVIRGLFGTLFTTEGGKPPGLFSGKGKVDEYALEWLLIAHRDAEI